jgi:hypothetical protein
MLAFNYDSYTAGVEVTFKQDCSSITSPQSPSDCTAKSNSDYNCCYGAGTAFSITRKQCFSLTVTQTEEILNNMTKALTLAKAEGVVIQCTYSAWIAPVASLLAVLICVLI